MATLFGRIWDRLFHSGVQVRLDSLEKRMDQLQQFQQSPPIYIERLHVDKIIVERLENSNNIANLGIQKLSGVLNIGVNYKKPDRKSSQIQASTPPSSQQQGKAQQSPPVQGPAYHIRAKPSSNS